MGTFKLSYCVITWLKNYKMNIAATIPAAYIGNHLTRSQSSIHYTYLGYCWDQAALYKASMMRGKSRMFAHVNQNPNITDVWNY